MLAQVAMGSACVVALGVVVRRGGPRRLWSIAGLLIFGIAWQFSIYGIDHGWAVTHHGLGLVLDGVQFASTGLLAFGAIRSGRSNIKPTPRDTEA